MEDPCLFRRRLIESSSVIVADLYRSTKGAHIIVDVQSEGALKSFKQLFTRIAEEREETVRLREVEWIVFSDNLGEIVLRLARGRTLPEGSLRVVSRRDAPAVCEWIRDAEGWLECCELVGGLVGPGHQYLNRGPRDGAEVELSFLERDIRERWELLNRSRAK